MPSRTLAQAMFLSLIKRRTMRVPPIPLRGELTSVRPATDADAELLVSWHDDPDVARYWDDKTFTHEQMLARLARPDVDPYIIEADGEPIGYLQAWFGKPSTDAGLECSSFPRRAAAASAPMRREHSRPTYCTRLNQTGSL